MTDWMDIEEFRQEGYIQEVNRRFLHPLGLALAINVGDNGRATGLAGIVDMRSDPEGWIYAPGMVDATLAYNVARKGDKIARVRMERFGYVIQPVGEVA